MSTVSPGLTGRSGPWISDSVAALRMMVGPASVIDVGSSHDGWGDEFRAAGVGDVVVVRDDLTAPAAGGRRFDLAVSVGAGDRVPAAAAPTLVAGAVPVGRGGRVRPHAAGARDLVHVRRAHPPLVGQPLRAARVRAPRHRRPPPRRRRPRAVGAAAGAGRVRPTRAAPRPAARRARGIVGRDRDRAGGQRERARPRPVGTARPSSCTCSTPGPGSPRSTATRSSSGRRWRRPSVTWWLRPTGPCRRHAPYAPTRRRPSCVPSPRQFRCGGACGGCSGRRRGCGTRTGTCRAYPDVASARVSPLWHYRRHGTTTRRAPHPWIDPGWYAARNPDVVAGGHDPVEHYLDTGWREAATRTRCSTPAGTRPRPTSGPSGPAEREAQRRGGTAAPWSTIWSEGEGAVSPRTR